MRAWLIGFAVAVMASASPAAAQSVKLDWMLGRWCMDTGSTCLDVEQLPNGSIATIWKNGDEDASQGVIAMENGLAVLTVDGDKVARETRRGPNEIVLKNTSDQSVADGGLSQLRYSRSGNQLSLEFTFGSGESHTNLYTRQP